MLHTLLIALHATAGVICFATGLLCIPLQRARSWRFRIYAGSLLAMLAFVAGSIAVSWTDLDVAARLTFAGLMGLGFYMLWRVGRASARLRRRDPDWRLKYLDDVGFTLISLFDGFVIVGAIDLGLSAWLVVLAAVSGVVAGVQAMKRVKSRLGATRPAPDIPGSLCQETDVVMHSMDLDPGAGAEAAGRAGSERVGADRPAGSR